MISDIHDLYLSMLSFFYDLGESFCDFANESDRARELVHGGCEWILYSRIQQLAQKHPMLVILYATENAGGFSMRMAEIVESLREQAFQDLSGQQSVLAHLEELFWAHHGNTAYQSEEVKYA